MGFTYTEIDCFWYLNLTDAQKKAYEQFSSELEQSKSLVTGAEDRYTLLRFMKARSVSQELKILDACLSLT